MPPAVPIKSTMGPNEWAMLLGLGLLWGGSFFFVEVALEELGPLTIAWCRVGFAALLLWAVVLIAGASVPRSPRVWRDFLVMGALNNAIPFCLIFWGQVQITASLASILNATTPVWTVLLAHLLTRDERLTSGRLVGTILGVGGIVVLVGPGALGGFGAHALAQLAVVAAAVSYAFAGIFGRRFAGLSPLSVAAGQVTTSTLLIAPFALVVEQPWLGAMPGAITWLALIGLAALSTAAAYVLYFAILARAGATNLLLVTLLIPPSAILLGVMVLGEAVTVGQLGGLTLIALGLAAIDGRAVRWLARRPARTSS